MSITCSTETEVFKAIQNIIKTEGVDPAAAKKALAYLEVQLKPVKDQVTKAVLEAVFTQIVFFYVILLIVLIVCVLWCCYATDVSGTATFAILFALVIITAIFVAIISTYVIGSIKSTVDKLVAGITQADIAAEKSRIETVVNAAAQVYLASIIA
jgi:uncharacterized membrane protein YqjE